MARNIGLQLYTVRESARRDFVGTLRKIAAIGYDGVESAGDFGGHSARELRAILDDLHLKLFSAHVTLPALSKDFERQCADLATLGARYVGLAWLSEDYRNAAGYARAARAMQAAAVTCAKHDLTFFYHNHDFEFAPLNGRYAFDVLRDATDPSLVKFELDAYWAAKAGVDPVGFMRELDGRLPLLHIKDMAATTRDFAIIGEGTLDFGAMMAAGDALGVDWYVVEQDRTPKGEIESARASFDNIVARGWR